MNTKLSGAQLVLVPIKNVGRNYFPYVENLNRRVIKYIDYVETYALPDTTDPGLSGTTDSIYVNIMNEFGTEYLHRDLPLVRLGYFITNGLRQPIFKKISLKTSYIDVQDQSAVGRTAAFVFWYDLPEFSQRNTSDTLITDAISIPITNVTRYNTMPDIERMVGKRFRRILGFLPAVTPELQPGVGFGDFVNMYITLRKGSYNIWENVPLYLLLQLYQQYKMELANITFDLQSSYITVGGGGSYDQSVIGKSVFLNVQYEG